MITLIRSNLAAVDRSLVAGFVGNIDGKAPGTNLRCIILFSPIHKYAQYTTPLIFSTAINGLLK